MAEPGVYNGEDYDKLREDDPHYREVEEDIDRLTGASLMGVYAQAVAQAAAEKVDKTIRTFHTGATRDTDEGKLDWEGFIHPAAMGFFVGYMHKHRHQADGTLRDADNWQKGIPRKQYMKSLVRHVWDLWTVWRTEPEMELTIIDLLCAIMFNVQGLLLEIYKGRDVSE